MSQLTERIEEIRIIRKALLSLIRIRPEHTGEALAWRKKMLKKYAPRNSQ